MRVYLRRAAANRQAFQSHPELCPEARGDAEGQEERAAPQVPQRAAGPDSHRWAALGLGGSGERRGRCGGHDSRDGVGDGKGAGMA